MRKIISLKISDNTKPIKKQIFKFRFNLYKISKKNSLIVWCCNLMPSVEMYDIDSVFGAQSQVAGRAAVSRHASQTPTRESIICAER